MKPSRSSTLISLRTVAADTSSERRATTVCEPTGCAVATYSPTIAPKIFDLRSSSVSAWVSLACAVALGSGFVVLTGVLALNGTECQHPRGAVARSHRLRAAGPAG